MLSLELLSEMSYQEVVEAMSVAVGRFTSWCNRKAWLLSSDQNVSVHREQTCRHDTGRGEGWQGHEGRGEGGTNGEGRRETYITMCEIENLWEFAV